MDDPVDSAVTARLSAGDPAAWDALFRAFAPRVWRTATRLVGPCPGAAADVVQETFLAAARSARQFDPARGTVAAWLFTITHTQAALHHRKRARADRLVAAAGSRARVPDAEPDPLERGETAERVRAALAGLPADYARLLCRKYFDGATVETLAAEEHVGPEAVRSKLARARLAFRTLYDPDAP